MLIRQTVRLLCALTLHLVVLVSGASGQDAAAPEDVFVSSARNAILIDATSGRVYYELAADTAVPPASMSKLMT